MLTRQQLELVADRLARQARVKTAIDVGVTRDVFPPILSTHGVRTSPAIDLTTAVSIAVHTGCDVVVAFGVGTGLDEAALRPAIAEMTKLAPRILLGSGPTESSTDSRTTPSSSLWARLFAEHAFYVDADFVRSLPVAGTLLFVRAEGGRDGPSVETLRRMVEERDRRIAELTGRVLAIEATITWRLRERATAAMSRLPFGIRAQRLWHVVRRSVEVLLDEGAFAAAAKVRNKLRSGLSSVESQGAGSLDDQYDRWLRRHSVEMTDRRQAVNEQQRFSVRPLVSVVVFASTDDTAALTISVDSIRRQIYPRWELLVLVSKEAQSSLRSVFPDAHLGSDGAVRVTAAKSLLAGLRASKGEFVALLAEGDRLAESALFEIVKWINVGDDADIIYTDEDEIDAEGRRHRPFFKPGWSPDLVLALDYLSRCCIFRRQLLDRLAERTGEADVCDTYDLVLRLSEIASQISHVPKVLYHRREGAQASDSESGRLAVERALRRRGHLARIEMRSSPGSDSLRRFVRYSSRRPLVSIIIPTRDRGDLLRQCLQSILERTDYDHYELLVLDNDSREPESLRILGHLPPQVRVLPFPGSFNYSAINNFGARHTHGEHLLFLNNDVQVISREWLTAMVEQGERPEVGTVGAKLLYPNGTIQHAGVVLGVPGTAGHAFRGQPDVIEGYHGLAHLVRNCTAVTGACLLVRRRVFDEVGGFDERLRIDLNDVDFCLRIRRLGYFIVYTPLARLYHYEGASRRRTRPLADERCFRARWHDVLARGDPYYNQNLTQAAEDWSLRL
jgi:GT2 family glycosyltransferase